MPKKNPASCEAGLLSLIAAIRLEEELQAELQNTSEVSAANLTESRTTGPNARAGVGTGLASHRISSTRGVADVELRMVEDVERFGPELKRGALFDREVLEDSHVKVQTRWIANDISARPSEGESLRHSKGGRVIGKLRLAAGRNLARWRDTRIGIADQSRERTRPNSISDTSIVAVSRPVGDTDREPGREGLNS